MKKRTISRKSIFMKMKKAQGAGIIFKLALGIAFFIAMLYILSLITPVWNMIKESLGLGYSLEDFEDEVNEKYAATQTMPAGEQKAAYEEIVALWESFSGSPSAAKLDPAIKTRVKYSYENLLRIYTAEMKANQCAELAKQADSSFVEKCFSFYKKALSAYNRKISVKIEKSQFDAADSALKGVAEACMSYCKKDNDKQESSCANFKAAESFCTSPVWDELAKQPELGLSFQQYSSTGCYVVPALRKTPFGIDPSYICP